MLPHLDVDELRILTNQPQTEEIYCFMDRTLTRLEPVILEEIMDPYCKDAGESDRKYLKWFLLEKLPEVMPTEKPSFEDVYGKICENYYEKIGYQGRLELFLLANEILKLLKGRIRVLGHFKDTIFQAHLNRNNEGLKTVCQFCLVVQLEAVCESGSGCRS